ncbi:MAG: FHA domain-containing protein [Vicinamibacteria bacterium]
MPARCPRCSSVVEENELPRMDGAQVLCPQCQQPLEMPEMTVPFLDPKNIPTAPASKSSGGALSDNKRYALVIVSGKEPGKVFPIEKARVTIGRTGCDIVLDDTELSRQHVLIAIDGTNARLEDLGSTNGTFVGGNRIERADLGDRSEFRVGSHELLFVMSDRE